MGHLLGPLSPECSPVTPARDIDRGQHFKRDSAELGSDAGKSGPLVSGPLLGTSRLLDDVNQEFGDQITNGTEFLKPVVRQAPEFHHVAASDRGFNIGCPALGIGLALERSGEGLESGFSNECPPLKFAALLDIRHAFGLASSKSKFK